MEVKSNKLKPNKTQINLIARAFDGVIKGFFDNPENEAKFEEWKAKKERANGKVNAVD